MFQGFRTLKKLVLYSKNQVSVISVSRYTNKSIAQKQFLIPIVGFYI